MIALVVAMKRLSPEADQLKPAISPVSSVSGARVVVDEVERTCVLRADRAAFPGVGVSLPEVVV